ncbi:MAG: photosystem I reaction center subunit XII [Moorea sp. SIO1G6]|uniref:phycobilisome rod-core linker polypeptide n=1 Tax=Moorena sp. SIO1G6 TaxID=2607840 RepID=UPI0013BF17DD|nr:phycobilisome rod-core linker polypeptide [Moorena sp. SIO1G6]NET63424.1 photosystem I reaction center subunit XII [Moorena sp. SIO1G6]
MVSTAPTAKFGLDSDLIFELWPTSGIDEVQAVIRAVYRQVLGNPHIMESERLVNAESQLCDRNISVREFVRAVAKSDFYRARYFESCAPYRFIELNFKHLLGRAPLDQTEISEHIRICIEQGYDAEIDSYINSDEYQVKFGENIVPYYCASSQIGQKQVGYNRTLSLVRGNSEVDSSIKSSCLVEAVATNSTSKIVPLAGGRAAAYADATEKTFKIVVRGAMYSGRRRRSTTEYIVPGSKMTPQIQRINRTSGTIVSITEIS